MKKNKIPAMLKIKLKISIVNKNNESFMGIGILWLLQKIKKFKSINQASKDMNMSYTKAIKILNTLEKNLGEKVLIRKQGGAQRCRTCLTPFGLKFIEKYDRYQKKVTRFAEKEFDKNFKS